MDGRTDMTNLIVAIHDFANAIKKKMGEQIQESLDIIDRRNAENMEGG
jgi:hypothetical protein